MKQNLDKIGKVNIEMIQESLKKEILKKISRR